MLVAFSPVRAGRGRPFLHQRLQLHGTRELRPRVTRSLPAGGTAAAAADAAAADAYTTAAAADAAAVAQVQPVRVLGLMSLRRFPEPIQKKKKNQLFLFFI